MTVRAIFFGWVAERDFFNALEHCVIDSLGRAAFASWDVAEGIFMSIWWLGGVHPPSLVSFFLVLCFDSFAAGTSM